MGVSRSFFSQAVQSGSATVSDKVVEFSSGTTGTPSDDAGIIINRGSSTNAFLGWDESEDKFVAATTSATGASTGNLTLTPTALKCGDLTVDAGDVVYGNGQNATMSVTATAHNVAGKPLTITAGTTTAGTTSNIAGGALTLQSGQGKGSGAGGDIAFQVSPTGGSGSALNSHATIMTVSADGLSMASGKGILTGTVAAADGEDCLTISNSSGNATFAADVSAGAAISSTTTVTAGTDLHITGGDMHFGNAQNATIQIGATAHNVAGKPLTISAGDPTGGTTDNIAGGALTLQAGRGKGSAAGGDIIFQVANAAGSGSSINSHATALTISDDKNATFAADVTVAGDIVLDDGGSLKEAGGTAAITFDGSGNVTKIGQDSPSSGQFLKWDGAKAVWDAASGGGSVSAVANGADNRIATFSSADALNGEANLSFDGSTLAVTGAMSTTTTATVGTDLTVTGGDIAYGNGQNATMSVAATAHNAAGKSLTISGGGTTAGTTDDIAGGDVVIAAGQGKGTGASGNIKFQIANSDAGSGSSLNALADAMVLDDLNMLTIKRDIDSDYTALKLYNQSDSNNTNGKVSMQFSLEDTSGNEVDAGKIICEKESAFTSTAGTQDAKFQWQLSLNGTMTDRMELSSGGNLETAGNITAGGAFYASEFMYHDGDTDTKIQFTADQINLLAGNVNMLKLKETTQNEAVFFEDGTDCDFRIEAASAAYFFYINSGDNKLFVGGNTANKLTDQMFNIQDGNFAMGKNSADAAGSEFIFAKSRHATDGNLSTIVQDNDILGEIVFKGTDGTDLESAAAIQGCVDGTPGNDDMPGKLIFKTTADGAKTLTTAMTINNSQQMICEKSIIVKSTFDGSPGTGSYAAMDYASTGCRIISRGTGGGTPGSTKGTFTIVTEANDAGPSNNAMVIANDNDVTFLGTVTDGSDSKLKTDVRNLDSMIPIINQLRPIKYKKTYKPEGNERSTADYYGFIAQEVQPHIPDIVHTNKDTDLSGNPTGTVTLSLAYTEMVPILTKAIQEQQALIEALTARVTALEN